MVVYHLPKISGNSGWGVNGTRLFGLPHWKIPVINGTSKKVGPFSRLERPEWKFVFHLLVLHLSHQFQDFGSRSCQISSTKMADPSAGNLYECSCCHYTSPDLEIFLAHSCSLYLNGR